MNTANIDRSFSSGHINVRSLLPKIQEVHSLLEENEFDILAVTETWLGPTITDEDVEIDGYKIYRRDRDGRGGGVCWYVRSVMRCELIEIVGTIEQLWIKLRFGGVSVSCGVVYRPPSHCPNEFLACLEDTLSSVTLSQMKCFVRAI